MRGNVDEANRAVLAQLGLAPAHNYLYCSAEQQGWRRWFAPSVGIMNTQTKHDPQSILVFDETTIVAIRLHAKAEPEVTTWQRETVSKFQLTAGFYEFVLTFTAEGKRYLFWIDAKGFWDDGVTAAKLRTLIANGFFARLPRRDNSAGNRL